MEPEEVIRKPRIALVQTILGSLWIAYRPRDMTPAELKLWWPAKRFSDKRNRDRLLQSTSKGVLR